MGIKKIKQRYGLTNDEISRILEVQNYKCKICRISESELKRKLAVDHCHETGKVRGMLCGRCNTGLGMFRDNEKYLETSIKYLKDSRNATEKN